jgi:zinc/manganese transport system permease protein
VDWGLIFDPAFRIPFITGLCLAAILPLIGTFMRMRNQWLATFALSQVAAAGAMLGLPLGFPPAWTAAGLASLAALLHGLVPRPGNSHYGATFLAGWAGVLLIAGNTQQGTVVAESLLRGQLYFSGPGHLLAALVLSAWAVASLRWLTSRLLMDRLFPDFFDANQMAAWIHRLGFGALLVFATVLSTLALGAIPAFALFFAPAWVAFILCEGWRNALWVSALIGLTTYVSAFALAVSLDQPLGPLLVLILLLTIALTNFIKPTGKLLAKSDS